MTLKNEIIYLKLSRIVQGVLLDDRETDLNLIHVSTLTLPGCTNTVTEG